MAHDRIGDDTLPLTHEFLSLMLAVRRPGVTDALNALRMKGLILYRRGEITVRDRKGMERTAGEGYGTPEAEYRRLMAEPWPLARARRSKARYDGSSSFRHCDG
jgi:hypothetical protein